jgi:Mn2+/Fe2+ NRAMP family transporter
MMTLIYCMIWVIMLSNLFKYLFKYMLNTYIFFYNL